MMTSFKSSTIPNIPKHISITLSTIQMKVKTYRVLSKFGQKPKKPKISCWLLNIFHKAPKESQSSTSLKLLVKLLKLMVFLVRKMVIITRILKTIILVKLVIILKKLVITLMLSKVLIMEKPYHIYMRNLSQPQRVINSKHLVATSSSLMQFKLLDSMLNMPSTLLLRRVTYSMSQKV